MSTAVLTTPVATLDVLCTIEEVMLYEHPALMQRYQEKLGISKEEAQQLFEDTKRFLYLCVASTDLISPTETIDFGWHEFILFTRDYAEFCQQHFGRFIHHRPRHPDDPPTNGSQSRRARILAEAFFGSTLSPNWSYPNFSAESAGPCDDCGCNAACNDD